MAQKYIFSIGWGKKYHSSPKKKKKKIVFSLTEKNQQKNNEIFQKKELDMRKQLHIFISFLLE